jgi:hypothetical protein
MIVRLFQYNKEGFLVRNVEDETFPYFKYENVKEYFIDTNYTIIVLDAILPEDPKVIQMPNKDFEFIQNKIDVELRSRKILRKTNNEGLKDGIIVSMYDDAGSSCIILRLKSGREIQMTLDDFAYLSALIKVTSIVPKEEEKAND